MAVKTRDRDLKDDLTQHYRRLRECYIVEYRRFVQQYQGHDPVDYGRRNMPVWDGGEDEAGSHHKPVWPQLARFALQRGICAFELTRAVFFNWGNRQSPPTPRQLMTDRALSLAASFREKKARAIEISVASARAVLAAELSSALRFAPAHRSREQVATSVIMDRSQAPVLVKYCAAIACGVGSIAWGMRHAAALEFLAYENEWTRALGEHLPGDFVEYAKEYVLPSLASD